MNDTAKKPAVTRIRSVVVGSASENGSGSTAKHPARPWQPRGPLEQGRNGKRTSKYEDEADRDRSQSLADDEADDVGGLLLPCPATVKEHVASRDIG
ncbi:MAG TPA: hypothetical protein VMM77_00850 [Gemmatimonadaceae bacterium]|nr:hypothetical protein [Gemmatimonadaceae bacterium]